MQAILGYEAPWPYNLLDDIFREPWDTVLTKDQTDGLEKALEILTQREEKAVDAYYKRGLNLEQAGREFNVTRERFRQILAKGVRKLRNPARKKLILYGLETSKEMSEVEQMRVSLAEQAYSLVQWQAELDARAELLGYRERKQLGMSEFSDEPNPDNGGMTVCGVRNVGIEELELSARSYNCLRRACIKTVGDLLSLSLEDMMRISNLGRKSREEIIDKMHEIGLKMSWEE